MTDTTNTPDTDPAQGATEIRANLSADAFAAVSMAISKDETRYYFHGVYVTPWADDEDTGALMVATNGHIMAVYFDRQGAINRPAILRGAFAATELKKKRGHEKEARRIHVTGDVGRVMKHERVARNSWEWKLAAIGMVQEIDGTFPDWRNVVPKFDGDTVAKADLTRGWNPDLITLAAKIAKRVSGDSSLFFSFTQTGATEPAILVSRSAPDLWLIVMPVRLDHPIARTVTPGGPVEAEA